MKKIFKLLFALVLTTALLTACGETAEEVKREVSDNFVTFVATADWEVTGETNTRIKLEKVDTDEFMQPEILFGLESTLSPQEQIDQWLNIYSDGKQVKDMTINGITYLVVERDTGTGKYIHMCTSPGSKLEKDARGAVTIEILRTTMEEVKPILATVSIKDPEEK